MNECEIKKRALELLSKMSIEDKIGQVTQITFNADNIEESCEKIRKIKPGSIILCWSSLGGAEKQQSVCVEALNILQKTAVTETPSKIPILFARDVIHGHHVAFPVPLTMTQSFDFDLIERSYDAIREEALSDGIKWTFAPMLDMSHEPRWGRIVEGPGEDPYIGKMFARSCVKGFQTKDYSSENSMLACAKHFVGYGASEGGRDYNHTEISDYNLQNNYLPAFKEAIDCGVATVMSGFNDVNGIPVTGNRKILTEILRNQLGFTGFVVSDWNAIAQLHEFSGFSENPKHSAGLALKAGVDMDMVCNCYFDNIKSLLKEEKITMRELDSAVLRVIETKLRFGLFEKPYAKNRTYNKEQHILLSKKLAEESIVLIKNNDNILPLNKNKPVSICGNFADEGEELVGTWSLDYDKSLNKTVREAIGEFNQNIHDFDESNRDEICLVVLGEKREVTGEAACLADISLSNDKISLIKKVKQSGRKAIGVLCFARPIVLGEAKELFDAIIWCGHGGSMASKAIASVLFGESEPSGRLTFTLPFSIGQLPIYYNSLPGSRKINGYYSDINPRHGNYKDCQGEPAYPFGYGLSYTTFKISDFACDSTALINELKNGKSFGVDFSVKNIGNCVGVCVPQLYIRDLVATTVRPLRSLVRFCKVTLPVGETKSLHFDIYLSDFGFYTETGEFIVEGGKFELYLGENCLADNKKTVELI